MHRLRLIIFAFIALCGVATSAAAPQTQRYISQREFERDTQVYTVDRQMRLEIPGGIFSENAYVYIENRNDQDLALPAGKEKMSNAYRYDVKVSEPKPLDRPVKVVLNYYGKKYNSPSVHYFDGARGAWQPVVSAADRTKKTVAAYLPFPAAEVVVLEDDTRTPEDVSVSVDTASATVVDATTGAVLYEDDGSKRYPLASLTKIMTGLVFLDYNPGWDETVTMIDGDDVGGSRAPLRTGERVTVRDLFNSMLVASGNNSARALARSTGLTNEQFVQRMNARAKSLGLRDTIFTDVTGIQRGNRSSARDAAQLARIVFSKKEFIDTTTKSDFSFYTVAAQQLHTVRNTNTMLTTGDLAIKGSKTGHLDASGYNLALKVARDDRDIIIVIFGARSRSDSFIAARDLAEAF